MRAPSLLQGEEWRDVPGFEGWYQVSNQGRVRSMDRVRWQKSRYGAMMLKKYGGKILKPTDNGHGYLIVSFRKNEKKKRNHYLHRLVAEAFVPNPDRAMEVNHKDYDKTNNAADNLEWVTRQGNIDYSLSRMCRPHNNKLPSSTGERFVRKRKNRFELSIKKKGQRPIYRSFKTLNEAKEAREVILKWQEQRACSRETP